MHTLRPPSQQKNDYASHVTSGCELKKGTSQATTPGRRNVDHSTRWVRGLPIEIHTMHTHLDDDLCLSNELRIPAPCESSNNPPGSSSCTPLVISATPFPALLPGTTRTRGGPGDPRAARPWPAVVYIETSQHHPGRVVDRPP